LAKPFGKPALAYSTKPTAASVLSATSTFAAALSVPDAQPIAKSAAQPIAKSAAQPVAKPAVSPGVFAKSRAAKPIAKAANANSAAQPVAKPVAKPAVSPGVFAKSAAQPVAKSGGGLYKTRSAAQPIAQPVAKPIAETTEKAKPTEKIEAVLFDYNATYQPSATHALIRLLYNSTTYDSPSEICCLKRENDDDCEDRVSYPVSPFVLSFPNSRAFELDGGHMNVLEQFDRYTDEEAKHFYNNAHQDSRGKTKAYRQLVQHQSKIQSLMPVDPATLLIVHNIYFFPELLCDKAVKCFPLTFTQDARKIYDWTHHL